MMAVGRVWLVGCGNMGGALLARWVQAGLKHVDVIDPAARGLPAGLVAHVAPPSTNPDVVVLAVKPQLWRAAVADLAPRVGRNALVISVMAGVSVADLHSIFIWQSVARAMPNTPARLGRGITALWMPADQRGRSKAETLFEAAGSTAWLDREADFDAVTGLSGSGPAYVFAMIEAMAAAGVEAGLSAPLADRLALATVAGAAALAEEGVATPSQLRAAVTSPNGTTAAGLAILQPRLDALMVDTVASAARRSRELSSQAV